MKRVKKNAVTSILAVCLAFIMAFSTGMTAAAEGGDLTSESAGTITISGIETDESGYGIGTLCAYQVIKVNVNNASHQPQSPVFKWDDSVASWVSTNFSSYIDTKNGNAVTDAFLDLADNSDYIKAFVDKLANAIRKTDSTITLTPASYELSTYSPVGDSKAITLENIPLGAYLFLVEGGVRIYSPGFASVYPAYDEETDKWVPASGDPIDVYMKSEEPGIDKTVEDYTYAIGQTVNYTLVVDVPDYPENAVDKKFIIADYLSEGLTFNKGSVRIYNYDDSKKDNIGTELTDSFADYKFTDENHPAEGTSPSFAKSFKDDGDYSILAEKVIVKYSATVNENAVVKEKADTDNKLDNKVYLIYNNNPYTEDGYREIPDEERVYTYGIQVTKTDNSDKEPTLLPGAEFNLKKQADGPVLEFIYDEEDGAYRLPLAAEITDDTVTKTTTLVTDSSGIIRIKGLDLGTYTLVETKAPDGYELPADPETVITLADDADDSGKPDGILNNDSDGTFETTVVNTKPGIIPVTGGVGTALFTIFGLLLMSGAVILVVTVSRRKSH